ncbi:hypothetical protein EVAR_21282_1 [Eumeta japonica]|uniref:Uncharacterized protein n=1 Tax=Eumeta variegata TaxID=151549 RepID=A0A4C1WLK3_EUMVA|nr:hypothetical protein EVAR_21282_1 [Eumeta japonica]
MLRERFSMNTFTTTSISCTRSEYGCIYDVIHRRSADAAGPRSRARRTGHDRGQRSWSWSFLDIDSLSWRNRITHSSSRLCTRICPDPTGNLWKNMTSALEVCLAGLPRMVLEFAATVP